jgi:chromosome segregation ATPase
MVAVTGKATSGRPASVQLYTSAVPHRMPRDLQPLSGNVPIYQQSGFRQIEEQRQEAERRAIAVEENFRAVQKRLKEALAQVKELEGRLSMNEAQNGTNDGDMSALRDQVRETSERLHKAELDNNALRERMTLRQQELDEARRLLTEVRAQDDQDELRSRLEAAAGRAAEMEQEIDRLASELEYTNTKFHMTKFSEALREFDNDTDELQIEEEDDLFEHPVIIRNRPDQTTPQRVK